MTRMRDLLRGVGQGAGSAPPQTWGACEFVFLNPGPLVDGELELVQPDIRRIDDMLAACAHPLTQEDDPEHAGTTREKLEQFLQTAPGGHEPGDASKGRVPSYHFWMRLRVGHAAPIAMAGTIGLRIGHTRDLEYYCGHIGYNVYPPARGHHYAERACRLLLPLARAHHLRPLWITTNPENAASRRTCQRLGAVLVDIVNIPEGHGLYLRGQRQKCRYRMDI